MARFLAPYFAQGPLSRLSVNQGDRVYTNAERLTALRDCLPVTLRNAYPWPHLLPRRVGKVIPLRRIA